MLDIDHILYSTPDALKIQLPDRTYFWVPKSITDSEHRIPRWFVEAKGLLPYLKSKLTYSQRKLEEFF